VSAEVQGGTIPTADELAVARVIQRSLLPETLPDIPGWRLAAHYAPARVLGGDLYDVVALPGDLWAIVLGDASDKSVPAALVMATTRALLRAAAQRLVLPGLVLARVNEDLAGQIPPGVFVTCFIALLEPSSGRLRFANAGQCSPVMRTGDEVRELRTTGWPLGILPEVTYDEVEVVVPPGASVVLYSDGLSETHAPNGEMLGAGRLSDALAAAPDPAEPIGAVLAAHGAFAGPTWDQEDDLTVLSLSRDPELLPPAATEPVEVTRLTVPSLPDVERDAAERVLASLAGEPLTDRQRDRLRTAVAETVMNAAEHGNHHRPDLMVDITVARAGGEVHVRVSDAGRDGPIPEPVTPDLDAKLAGLQSPRGWGLFLIRQMVDRVEIASTTEGNTVTLTMQLEPHEKESRG
jgi:anti-sigma regulatory factor (Ser/Thr protein kinase)